jgi:hypothetical protein
VLISSAAFLVNVPMAFSTPLRTSPTIYQTTWHSSQNTKTSIKLNSNNMNIAIFTEHYNTH